MQMKIKVALAQFNIQFADPDKNQQRVAELTSIAAKAGADVIVFPEM